MNRPTHKAGFTLIELLLVMLIIAIATAIMAPSFSGFSRGRRLPNTALDLVTTEPERRYLNRRLAELSEPAG